MNRLAAQKPHLSKEYIGVITTVALPVMLQNLIGLGLNLVDVLMIGMLGVDELAAVGAANRIFSIFGMISFGLISGTSVFLAQYWGVRDIPNIRRVFGFTLVAECTIALFFMLAIFLFDRQLLHLFVKEANVLDLGQDYIQIVVYSYVLTAISFTASFSCRAIRKLKIPTLIQLAAIATNTLLNYGLIFGRLGLPQLGVRGAAIATLTARALETVLLLLFIYTAKEHPLAGKLKELFSIDRLLRRKVTRTMLPVMLTESGFALGSACHYIAFGLLGKEAVAVMQIASVMNEFFQAVFFGLGNATAVITGNELGRGQKETVYENGKQVIKITVIIGIIMGVVMFALRGFIVSIYNFEDTTTSLMLAGALTVYAAYMVPRVLDYVLVCGLLRAGGDTRFCLIANSIGIWAIGVPLAFFGTLVLHWPLVGVLSLVLLGDLVSCILCLYRFKSKVWINTLI